MAPVYAQHRDPQGRSTEEVPSSTLPRGRKGVGRDDGPLRSKEAVRSPPPEAPDLGIPEHAVRLRVPSRGGEGEDRGPAQEDLRYFALVRSDEGGGEELVSEDGAAVPVEPWYAEPGGVGIEEGLDKDVWDPPSLPLLTVHIAMDYTCFSLSLSFLPCCIGTLVFLPFLLKNFYCIASRSACEQKTH